MEIIWQEVANIVYKRYNPDYQFPEVPGVSSVMLTNVSFNGGCCPSLLHFHHME